MKVVIRPLAREDLDRTLGEGMRLFGPNQAYAYVSELLDLIEALPRTYKIYPERSGFDPPIRVCPHKSHLILYRVEREDIVILRVRHGREDWLIADPE